MFSSHAPTTRRAAAGLATALAAVPALAGCSLLGGGADDDATGEGRVVLITHSSFSLPEELTDRFESENDVTLEIRNPGDAGTLATEIALNPDDAGADVVFGLDSTFATRVLDADALEPYAGDLPPGVGDLAIDGEDRLVPVDTGNVCVNVDTAWFEAEGQEPPQTLEDLTDPAYADLFVTPGAETSSPGLAFLLATIDEYGDDWPDYWQRLLDNGAQITEGWEDAYTVDFTAGGGSGATRPIVLSYDSSPAFTIGEDGESTTAALLDTCYRQVEYAGVLRGADNPEAADALVDFLLSEDVQAALPESMYVFPARSDVDLPDDWARFAVQPDDPAELAPAEVAENRDAWLTRFRDLITA